ncbi:MAG TPA: hypothetical protein VFG20_10255 [Planctomycetaceae bacterium]|nr:hypothetical protein [Planctomycetaceae bacterium]
MAAIRSGLLTRALPVLCSLIAGYLVAQIDVVPNSVRAEVRETTPRAAFQAGSERSEAVLKEIAATLKTMDGRLERLEKIAVDRKLP